WAFEDDLVGTDAVHLVVDALAALVQVAFDLQGGKFVRHDADAPAGLVGLGASFAVGKDFVGRLVLVARAKWAVGAAAGHRLDLWRDRSLGPVRGDDDPSADNGVLAQFRHRQSSKVLFGKGVEGWIHEIQWLAASAQWLEGTNRAKSDGRGDRTLATSH